jgi:hypothetical protein
MPLLALALFITCSAPLRAGNEQPIESTPHWHYGLGIGLSLLAYNNSNIVTAFAAANNTSTLNSNDFSFKFFGGYQFDPFIGLEFGLSDLGNTIVTNNGSLSTLFNTSMAYIDVMLTQRYNDKAALYGKVGTHFWNIGPNNSTTLITGTDLSLGAGLEFNLYGNSARAFRVEWNRYLFDKIYLDTVDTLTLNLVIRH